MVRNGGIQPTFFSLLQRQKLIHQGIPIIARISDQPNDRLQICHQICAGGRVVEIQLSWDFQPTCLGLGHPPLPYLWLVHLRLGVDVTPFA
jgi:hypothetical protein